MTIRSIVGMGLSLAVLTVVAPLNAQKKGKPAPAPATPVSAQLRCPQAADCLVAERVDRITGDGLGPYVGDSTDQGAFFNSSNKLDIHYTTSYGRPIGADFGDPVSSGACVTAGNCRKNFNSAEVRATSYPSITTPVDAAQTALPNGFNDIPVGGSSKARFKLDFADPAGRALVWTVRFNAVAVNTGKGRSVMTHEGFYRMPFRIVVTR